MDNAVNLIITDNVLIKYEGSYEEVVIPEGVREIGVSAFDRIESIKKIILPESVKVIQKWAFFGCKNLEEIILPQGLLSIGVRAFCCTAIKKIVIPGGVEIAEEAFGRCDLLQDVSIGEGIKILNESCFLAVPFLKNGEIAGDFGNNRAQLLLGLQKTNRYFSAFRIERNWRKSFQRMRIEKDHDSCRNISYWKADICKMQNENSRPNRRRV